MFVLLNGGVVLGNLPTQDSNHIILTGVIGDKENHIASIHIPQMLYIWPYFVFFSWPIIVPHIVQTLSSVESLKSRLPRLTVAFPVMALMALAVHFNTIVHPFTLADNRHYVFYVFKLLRKHPLIRYGSVPIYFTCAWAAVAAVDVEPAIPKEESEKEPGTVTKASSPGLDTRPTRVSFLLVYIISTTLSLITAPLVEPRYFILPWLIWRLHAEPPSPISPRTGSTYLLRPILQADKKSWLILELIWFAIVNWTTCWMFLTKGFEWPQEPGRVQRFMW
jgi:alpha-1,2-glucosyltransferase